MPPSMRSNTSGGRPGQFRFLGRFQAGCLANRPRLGRTTQEQLPPCPGGYAESKTAFYTIVAVLRPPRTTPIVRFEGSAK